MSENDTDYMWPWFAFLFAFDQRLYFPIVLLLFRHLFLKAYLCVFCPSCCWNCNYFLLHSFQAFLVGPYIFLFMPLPGDHRTRGPEHHTTTGPEPQDQRTTGPEDERTTGPEDHRTRGPEDHSTRGPQGQRSLNFFSRGCKYFFQGTWIFFQGT